MNYKIVPELEDSKAIVGFITSGVIGTVCAEHFVRTNRMRYISPILSKNMDPLSMVADDGKFTSITKAYSNNDLSVVMCEVNFINRNSYFINEVASEITSFILDNCISEVILIDSFRVSDDDDEKIYISSSTKTKKELASISEIYNVNMLSRLLLHGINASIINKLCVYDVDNLIVISSTRNIHASLDLYKKNIEFLSYYLNRAADVKAFESQYNQFVDDVNSYKDELMRTRDNMTEQYIS